MYIIIIKIRGLESDAYNPRAIKSSNLIVTFFFILPSTEHKNNVADPKADRCPSSTAYFVPLNCCLGVDL